MACPGVRPEQAVVRQPGGQVRGQHPGRGHLPHLLLPRGPLRQGMKARPPWIRPPIGNLQSPDHIIVQIIFWPFETIESIFFWLQADLRAFSALL
eukprot:scaffold129284_cov19-Prasinocladus_malaysianus.AAC.1